VASELLESGSGSNKLDRKELSAFWYDWLLRGGKRTLSPFHRGVVTTYTLEVGAAGDGDNRDHSFSAFRAARCSIHEVLPIFALNPRTELLFHPSVAAPKQEGSMEAAVDRVMPAGFVRQGSRNRGGCLPGAYPSQSGPNPKPRCAEHSKAWQENTNDKPPQTP
jgi:hypothetical protein